MLPCLIRFLTRLILVQEKGRVFVGLLLGGIRTSAHVEIIVTAPGGKDTPAGDFNILGGSAEMPWSFDRLYRYEITDVSRHHTDYAKREICPVGTTLLEDQF